MAMSREFGDHLVDLLAPLGDVRAKRLFGGGGLYLDGTMFALVADDVVFLKVDDANRPDFEARGMAPFRYRRGARSIDMSYYEAPAELMDDADELSAWARRAWEAARRAGVAKKNKKKKTPRKPA